MCGCRKRVSTGLEAEMVRPCAHNDLEVRFVANLILQGILSMSGLPVYVSLPCALVPHTSFLLDQHRPGKESTKKLEVTADLVGQGPALFPRCTAPSPAALPHVARVGTRGTPPRWDVQGKRECYVEAASLAQRGPHRFWFFP